MTFTARLVMSAVWPLLLAAAEASGQITITASRLSDQPVLKPGPGWSSTGIFNPAAVEYNGKDFSVLLFRATGAKMISRIGYAESSDGLHFKIRQQPVLEPVMPYEIGGGGVEDPRLVNIGGTFYLTYTGYNGKDAQLCATWQFTRKDLIHWQRKEASSFPLTKDPGTRNGRNQARSCRKR